MSASRRPKRGDSRVRRAGNGAVGKRAGTRGGENSRPRRALYFDIPSDMTSGNQVQRQIMEAVENNGYNEHSRFAIRLALEEALINAIKHGNQMDAGKRVRVKAMVTPQRTEVVIEDEGEGFKRRHVPDPTSEENIERLSGRGILLMESYMNQVRWTLGGRRVKIVKINGKEAG